MEQTILTITLDRDGIPSNTEELQKLWARGYYIKIATPILSTYSLNHPRTIAIQYVLEKGN